MAMRRIMLIRINSRLMRWMFLSDWGSFSNSEEKTLTSWKPKKACVPGRTTLVSSREWSILTLRGVAVDFFCLVI